MKNNLGAIYRIHRKSKGITLDEVSTKSGLALSRISEFENGRSYFSEEILETLYSIIHIEYKNNEADMATFRKCFYDFYEDLLHYKSYDDSYAKVEQLKESIYTTEVYPQYLLTTLVYQVFNKSGFDDIDLIEQLEDHIDYLDNKQKQICYDTIGLFHKKSLDYDKALSYYDKAAIYGDLPVSAMIYYHKAQLLDDIGCIVEALECIMKAKAIFDKQLYFNRSILCNGTIAMIYSQIGLNEQTIEIYKQCIIHMKEFGLIRDLKAAYNNLAWFYVLCGHYEEAISLSLEGLELNPRYIPFCFYMAYSYEQLGNRQKAIDSIKLAKKYKREEICTSYMASMIDSYHVLLMDRKEYGYKLKKLQHTLIQAEKYHDHELQLFVLKIIVNLIKKENQKEDLIYYQERMLNLYEKRK